MGRVRAESRTALDDAFRRVGEEKLKVVGVQLVGHADRLTARPGSDYNQRLSERRAMAVRQYIIAQGIPAEVITYEWRGDTEQVQACDGYTGARLKECLLPNRRVEVKFDVQRIQVPPAGLGPASPGG
nr:OmpA family protein [Lysobacter auxotrophicus]